MSNRPGGDPNLTLPSGSPFTRTSPHDRGGSTISQTRSCDRFVGRLNARRYRTTPRKSGPSDSRQSAGIFAETAGGVSIAVTKKLIESGHIDRKGVTVIAITGNGLKTPDAVPFESPEVIDAKIDSFERVLKGVAHVA